MNEQIERLKKNWEIFERLPINDRTLLNNLDGNEVVYRSNGGKWQPRGKGGCSSTGVYRIHEDYNPKPDTPVFPGYVLCEVVPDPNLGGNFVGFWKNSGFHPLDYAPRFGRVGYVPKEKIGDKWQLFTVWPVWVNGKKGRWNLAVDVYDINNGYYPADLGWVVFKESKNE